MEIRRENATAVYLHSLLGGAPDYYCSSRVTRSFVPRSFQCHNSTRNKGVASHTYTPLHLRRGSFCDVQLTQRCYTRRATKRNCSPYSVHNLLLVPNFIRKQSFTTTLMVEMIPSTGNNSDVGKMVLFRTIPPYIFASRHEKRVVVFSLPSSWLEAHRASFPRNGFSTQAKRWYE